MQNVMDIRLATGWVDGTCEGCGQAFDPKVQVNFWSVQFRMRGAHPRRAFYHGTCWKGVM